MPAAKPDRLAVVNAGYDAQVAGDTSPKSEPLTDKASVLPEPLSAAASPVPAETHAPQAADDSVQLLLSSMSCASSLSSKVQRALEGVNGVERARVNLAERSALVSGNADQNALIAAVERAGYGAGYYRRNRTPRAPVTDLTQKHDPL